MRGNRFSKGGCFKCRNCGRSTRNTGDNGSVDLCPDCYEGFEQENGMANTDCPAEAAQYEKDMREAFQRAVDKGGVVKGYTPSK